ncbi:3-hydroxybutyryl-CoA dehydrogenase [bacterium]|nr:MAG: 3-hydroxybutyryl-CoA dehydrogenase [bacterium]
MSAPLPAAPGTGAAASGPTADAVIGVVGAGTMGAGIAQVAAWSGHRVVLFDIAPDFVARGTAGIARLLRRGAEKGRHTPDAAEAAIARIGGTVALDDLGPCGLIIEAAPERLDLKRDLFARLEAVVDAEAILATNTSTLSVASIAGGLARPERVCGLHFFNPAPLMPLVEVIRGPRTDPAVAATVVGLARLWGKTPVEAQDRPGFIVNRVARPFYGEALRLLGEGAADVATLDRLARDAGFPMGPFELMDLIGIDVNYAAACSVYEGFFHDPRFRPHPIQRAMVESGRLGRKTGHGYYAYPDPS